MLGGLWDLVTTTSGPITPLLAPLNGLIYTAPVSSGVLSSERSHE